MNTLKQNYLTNIIPKLIKTFNYTNIHNVPKIKTIIINRGLGLEGSNRIILQKSIEEFRLISGQHPIVTLSKKSIATFKIRKGIPLGLKVTLRRSKMYNFLEKLIHIVLPRIPNFYGLSIKNFDKYGNFNFGINNQLVFPEINYDKIDKKRGFNFSILLDTNSIEASAFLLKELKFPLII